MSSIGGSSGKGNSSLARKQPVGLASFATYSTYLDGFIQKDESSGCWLWTGVTSQAGYGRVGWWSGKVAHREVYLASGRVIPEGWDLDHICQVKACVNPDHLQPLDKRSHGILTFGRLVPCPFCQLHGCWHMDKQQGQPTSAELHDEERARIKAFEGQLRAKERKSLFGDGPFVPPAPKPGPRILRLRPAS